MTLDDSILSHLPQAGHSFYIGGESTRPSFRVTVTKRSSVTISGTVEEVIGFDQKDQPVELKLYLTFYLKWDGCCHVTFGEKDADRSSQGEPFQDGYLHLCGADCWEQHIHLMAELYRWAEWAIPMQKDTSGMFEPELVIKPVTVAAARRAFAVAQENLMKAEEEAGVDRTGVTKRAKDAAV